ncbi:hypothetical protein LshimejAT787_0802190 [Lyophyllum shimeji]|uniref:Uncharacterized protein n=1 Tax=Lyophyllum shimeji TaxID=47721 RepID=A0A9P3PQU7_LYOSH|nr:hypothetical protein LshimejAT787_0802190 [Lyophyllum shimeji]
MKFASSAAVLSLAGLVAASSLNIPRQNCPEATRFGVLSVSPTDTPLNPGDNFNVNVDFNCGMNNFGIVPKFLDYTIVVPAPNNNGHEQPIVLARRTLAAGATADTFTAQVPHGFYFKGAQYSLLLTNNYPIKGTDGSEVIVQGGIYAGLNLNTTDGL